MRNYKKLKSYRHIHFACEGGARGSMVTAMASGLIVVLASSMLGSISD